MKRYLLLLCLSFTCSGIYAQCQTANVYTDIECYEKQLKTDKYELNKIYNGFYAFSEWLYNQTESTWQISLDRLAQLLFRYLCEEMEHREEEIKALLIEDIMTVRGRKMPSFLRENYVPHEEQKEGYAKLNKRQLKHATV